MWDGTLLWCNSWQSLGQSLLIFSRSPCKRHSSVWNRLFGPPGQFLCEQSCWCLTCLDVGLTRVTRHNILEDGVLHSHRRENHRSYKKRFVWGMTYMDEINLVLYVGQTGYLLKVYKNIKYI
jgi:hypothetical protein